MKDNIICQDTVEPYKIVRKMGGGSYGQVFEVVGRNGELYAMKKISNTPGQYSEVEIKAMRSMNHPNIVKIVDYYERQGDLHIVMQHCPDGDLFNYIANSKYKEDIEADIIHVIRQIVDGCLAMNQKGIIHRDIKPQNILLTGRILKISDFGCAKIHHLTNYRYTNQSFNVGTPMYSAPEILNFEPYDERCDVWSLGIILYFMIYEIVPFVEKHTSRLRTIIAQKTNKNGIVLPNQPVVSEQLKQLLQGMLRYRQAERPTWSQIINMRLFNPKISHIEQYITYLLTVNSIIGWIVQSVMQNFMQYFNKYYLCRMCHCLTLFMTGNRTLVKMIMDKDRMAERYFDQGQLKKHYFRQEIRNQVEKNNQKLEQYQHYMASIANQYVPMEDILQQGKSGRYYLSRAQKKIRKLLNQCRYHWSYQRILLCLAIIAGFDRYLGQQHYMELSLPKFTSQIKDMSDEQLRLRLNSQLDRI